MMMHTGLVSLYFLKSGLSVFHFLEWTKLAMFLFINTAQVIILRTTITLEGRK